MDKKEEILRILKEIRTTDYCTMQSIDLLLEYGFKLTQYLAFSGEAMAEAKELLHKRRQEGLREAAAQYKNGPTMIIKDYINDLSAVHHGYYELCERCNRACTHTIDLIRTAVSSLKQEMIANSYSQSMNKNNY